MSFKIRNGSRIKLILNTVILSLCIMNKPILASFTEEDLRYNTVILRVWHSGLNGGEHYGHVSLQTPHSYVSLWPSGEERTDLEVGCIKAKARFNGSYKDDLRDEDRREDARYHLSLPRSTLRIDIELARLKNRSLTWFFLGTSLDEIKQKIRISPALKEESQRLAQNENVFNCASIVHYLLRKGGLDLTDSTYLDVGSIHNPFLQGILVSFATSARSDIVNDIALLQELIYPDKISYTAKRAMIDQFATSVGHDFNSSLTYYLRYSTDEERIYSIIKSSNFQRTEPSIGRAIKELKDRRDSERPCVLM